MTFGTAGTNATTSLTATFHPGSFISPAGVVQSFVEADNDIATIQQLIRDDQNPNQPVPQGLTPAYSRAGQLFIPNRGWLKVFPGDLVCVDANGWPLLVSARSIATGGWTKTAT